MSRFIGIARLLRGRTVFLHRVPARKWSEFDLAQDWKDPLAVDAAREWQMERKKKGDSYPSEHIERKEPEKPMPDDA